MRGASKRQAIRAFVATGAEDSRVQTAFQLELAARFEADGVNPIARAAECFQALRHAGTSVALGRPAPDPILRAMAETGVGWNIGGLSGAHGRDALARSPHTHIVRSVADLRPLWGP